MTGRPENLDTALAYLARGWAVIPVQSGEKRPLVRWEAYQQAHPTAEQLRHWFRRWPDAGIGIVTGAVSNLVVVDIDPRHGGDDSLAELERHNGALPETVEVLTGGGRHLYFAHPGPPLHNRAALAPGLDLRGDGGYVVAPPSLHASGRSYEWEIAHHPNDRPLAPMPSWLLALARGPAELRGHPLSYWRELAREGVREGARNATVASFAGHLLWHGVDEDVVRELLLCWNRQRCHPPLSDDEVARTVDSILRTRARHHQEG